MDIIVFPNFNKSYNILIWPHHKHDETNKGYFVYCKATGETTFTKLNITPILVNFYKHTETFKYKVYEYKVKYKDTDDVEHEYAGTNTNQTAIKRKVMGNVFPAIKLITDKSFEIGKAEYCKILLKPVIGTRCPDCYDSDTQDVTTRWCDTCHNTKISGGYVEFENILTRFGNQGTKLEPTDLGYELRESVSIQFQDYPFVRSEDIIIRPTGERYFIQGDTRRIQVQSLLIKQICNVKEIMIGTDYYDL